MGIMGWHQPAGKFAHLTPSLFNRFPPALSTPRTHEGDPSRGLTRTEGLCIFVALSRLNPYSSASTRQGRIDRPPGPEVAWSNMGLGAKGMARHTISGLMIIRWLEVWGGVCR